jgi:hypothetical protein
MPTLPAPEYDSKLLTPKRYVGSPLRFVMLQSEMPPYERIPLAGSSLHMRRTHRKTSAASFHDAMHAAMGGFQLSRKHLPRVSDQVSPNRNTRNETLLELEKE